MSRVSTKEVGGLPVLDSPGAGSQVTVKCAGDVLSLWV